MSAPGWLSYVGAVTGVVGTLTGIAGAVMGYISYRRSSQLKALDLRLELRKLEADTDQGLRDLPNLLNNAKVSRLAVAAATGRLLTGWIEGWKQQCEADLSAVCDLQATFHYSADEYTKLTHFELETKLVEIHCLHRKVEQYAEKYRAELAADDKEREHIRADMRARHS